jgi:hypothetical protein
MISRSTPAADRAAPGPPLPVPLPAADPMPVTAPPAPAPPPVHSAPGALRLLVAAPATVARYYLRWVFGMRRARVGPGAAGRAEAWAVRERAHREGPGADVMAKLDFWAFVHARRRAPRLLWIMMLIMPARAAVLSVRAAAALGGAARETDGISRFAQALELWALQLRFPITYANDPWSYYAHQLHSPARRADAGWVLGTLHQNLLTGQVNAAGDHVMDKRVFARRCKAAGLPHVPTLAEVRPDGAIAWEAGRTEFPAHDLFSKPVGEANGTGAARWIWEGEGRYRAESGALLDAGAVLAELQTAARRGPIIVQPRLRNHPTIDALVGPTVATVRLASLILPGGAWIAALAIQRSAAEDSAVDNSAKGGCAAPVDIATGTLGSTLSRGPLGIRFTDEHPYTGARTTGERIPFWEEAVALAERAHRAFDRHPVVGWDIAITPAGPVLVEANILWNARSLQAAHRLALGRLPYARHLLDLLERGDQARPRAG